MNANTKIATIRVMIEPLFGLVFDNYDLDRCYKVINKYKATIKNAFYKKKNRNKKRVEKVNKKNPVLNA
jgi:hypothetical protein